MPIGMVWLIHREKQGVIQKWIITDISPIRSECDVADAFGWLKKKRKIILIKGIKGD